MKEIFRYKSKNILYSTGAYEEDEDEKQKRIASESAMQQSAPAAPSPFEGSGLTPEEMAIVEHSKSDNRISDSVADLVAAANK